METVIDFSGNDRQIIKSPYPLQLGWRTRTNGGRDVHELVSFYGRFGWLTRQQFLALSKDDRAIADPSFERR